MAQSDFNSLAVFITVARERSFTRAAAHLGVSQSAISHSIRSLEERLGIRLLTRTTRGASPTEAGERLLVSLVPYYEGIETEIAALGELRDKPAGTIRITSPDHAASSILWPKLSRLLPEYPDLTLEINIGYRLIDIVAERFDAGVRIGDQVAKDMIAVRISPDLRMAVVGAPSYFAHRAKPQIPQDLTTHNCANLRLPTHGGLYAWEFSKDGKALHVQVSGQMIFSNSPQIMAAALQGYGLAYAPEDLVQAYVEDGRLIRVLEDWSPTFPGYHLYYPSRRQSLPAFALVVNALRYKS
ncbi:MULTISPECIES: LysR family transcriptional regulator [Pseudomonas syringae group]|uniref:LysR family transcriptional regulator n=3 Tax=Pseudomonas syringae group TaxID=136849 RepID=A0AAW4DZW1_PSESX|nr:MULTISPECIES: LysR family transcriptional regulator [Pseudomonas syringae group]AVI83917.1 LysR family transcriptional regulator [Pseudomonas syringae pv. tomato]EEB56719.1 transcription regulator protein [Pseudomonas syringae pv. tomato T1]KGK92396.1 LysR family transcriptional regulator [Pseudomonas syringae pv. tomato]KUR43888.1 HTH-type transcriptional regulator DmlR [Pseudomonas syringae pv. tomato]KUR48101.1 HTH-type transcriptional regulator DmlR [Pseudomonas syringae pv. tomato]